METTTIRINKDTHNLLKEISKSNNISLNDLIIDMSSEYQKKIFWSNVNESYKKLQQNKETWNEVIKERKVWEQSLGDNLG